MKKTFKDLKSGDFIYMICHDGTIYKLEVSLANDLTSDFRRMWPRSDIDKWLGKHYEQKNIFLKLSWNGFTPISFKKCFNESSGEVNLDNFFKNVSFNENVHVATTRGEAKKIAKEIIKKDIEELKEIRKRNESYDVVFKSLKWDFEAIC
jgi:hypothetical protein